MDYSSHILIFDNLYIHISDIKVIQLFNEIIVSINADNLIKQNSYGSKEDIVANKA